MKNLQSTYDPHEVEDKQYAWWQEEKLFSAKPDNKRAPYTIVIPPPNVTGVLHMGHALNNTIQDILIRWQRMKNMNALWVPGTDHAGIATQNVVEKKLAKEGSSRDKLGREKFLEQVWDWKEDHGSTIIRQLKRLGSSCDWDKERFTMDEGLSNAVMEVFTRLYKKGLIYRGNYIINWCPRCHTALSDEEATHVDTDGKLYYVRYPLADKSGHIIVATTRPETMLGDVAVAVHPDDDKHRAFQGKMVSLPLTGRDIPVICDDVIDLEFGTGALKVTPAHDPVDFEIGLRHDLEPFNVMAPDGTMNEHAGEFAGMDRFVCRKEVIARLEADGLLERIEEHQHAVGHCYRCDTVVEPRLSLQWFVSMKPLAKPAIAAVKDDTITFHPERWTKVYLEWMENIRDWCISRQIWWGHRIPIWYCDNCVDHENAESKKGIVVGTAPPQACPDCGGSTFTQDPDVLDTWFSSWLWPFSTLGWPENTDEAKYFYPTNTLVTAQEIIFFWVARMIMAGCEFMGEVPFRDVYIHGTVRDDTGKKMSKSLGNVIDPLEIIDEFGADALRFSMISITAQGQDVFLSKDKFLIGRNFANKIWNATRFVFMSLLDKNTSPESAGELVPITLADRWILSSLQRTIEKTSAALEAYNFNEAASVLYDFFWHQYCDWYLELIKPLFNDDSSANTTAREAAAHIATRVLETCFRLLHPIIPFITEELWQHIKETGLVPSQKNTLSIMTAPWPKPDTALCNDTAENDMRRIIDIIVAIRNIRSELRIPVAQKPAVVIYSENAATRGLIDTSRVYLERLARVSDISIIGMREKPAQSASAVLGDCEVFIPLEGVIDLDEERKRLTKQRDETAAQRDRLNKQLQNTSFVDRAPEHVVQSSRDKLAEAEATLTKIEALIKDLVI